MWTSSFIVEDGSKQMILSILGIFSFNEAILFMARMLYPSYYFDLYDEIINKETKESKLLNIRNKICEYEELLKEIYSYLHLKYNIPEIEWLKKI